VVVLGCSAAGGGRGGLVRLVWWWEGPVIKVVHVGHCVGLSALSFGFTRFFIFFLHFYLKIIFL
jgi:hypothetical protein